MSETTTKMCRICLMEIAEKTQMHIINNYSDMMLELKLSELFPEMDLSFTPNSICCQTCTDVIQQMYELKQTCLQSQDIVKNFDSTILRDVTLTFEEVNVKEEDLDIYEEELCEPNVDHAEASYYCYNCDYKTNDKESLVQHMHVHVNTRIFCSDHGHAGGVRRYLIVYNGVIPFKCYFCKFITNFKEKLRIHLATMHKKKKLFKCNVCSYSGHSARYFRTHLLLHNSVKPFKCHLCNYCTHFKKRLSTHLTTHKHEKPFQCKECNYSSACAEYFKKHLLAHKNVKPFKCHMCKFSSNHKHCLRKHLKTHTGEKPYHCSKCNYSSGRADNLKTHLLVHNDVKHLKCNICVYSTKYKHLLKAHLITHINKKSSKSK